jgi:DNA-directed RNA polymerase specialized sigma24 family protein
MFEGADDADLLIRYARNRAEDAFGELVRRYIGLVYHAALRQVNGDAHLAQDVTQQVFILLARKAGALVGHRTIAGWLHVTTRLVSSEVRRAEQRRQVREQQAYTMQQLASEADRETDWGELGPIIEPKNRLQAFLGNLRNTIVSLRPKCGRTQWADYYEDNS